MNNIQGPPLHYPNSHESTHEVYRTNTNDTRRTPNFSRNESPRFRTPVYGGGGNGSGSGRAPFDYQEDAKEHGLSDADARRKSYYKLAGSLLIVVIIALCVAGVMGKMLTTRTDDGASTTSAEPTQASTSAPTADHMRAYPSSSSTTVVPTTLVRTTPTALVCRSSTGPAWQTGVLGSGPPCDVVYSNDDGVIGEARLVGVDTHASQGCLVSQASYKGADGAMRFQCSVSCRRTRTQGEPARAEVTEDWGSCG